jgi:hypothetical protein
MALQKFMQFEGAATIQTLSGTMNGGKVQVNFSAYIKVVSIKGNKSNVIAKVEFKGETQNFTKQYEIPVSVLENSPNFIKQVYEHLKTMPEFIGAIDC